MTIADVLTVSRLILVPFFLIAFLKGEMMTAFILFTIAGVTDLIDGSIARWLKTPSELGAFLDPIADKALMVTTVTCLLIAKIVPLWFFLLALARDFSILAGLAYLRFRKIPFGLQPVMASKVGTLSNIILVVFGFLSFLKPGGALLGFSFLQWFTLFLWISTALILVSGCQYGLAGIQILKRKKHVPSPL